MPGQMITFPINGRTADGYLAMPERGTGPGVVLIQEWWGLVPHIKEVADRLAAEGFAVLAPDLYHGESAGSPDEAQRLLMAMNMAETSKELRGAARHLLEEDAIAPGGNVGVMGFCLGGQLAVFAATEHPELFGAVVDFYGVFNPKVDVRLDRLRAPVQGHFGEHDRSAPPDRTRALVEDIRARGGSAEGFWYDAGHGFFHDTGRNFAPDAAREAWSRAVPFLHRTLGA